MRGDSEFADGEGEGSSFMVEACGDVFKKMGFLAKVFIYFRENVIKRFFRRLFYYLYVCVTR